MTRHNVIKSISIDRTPAAVLATLSDPKQLPKWLFFNITHVQPGPDGGGWEFHAAQEQGILNIFPLTDNHGVNYEILLPDQNWFIPIRIIPNEDGTTILLPLIHGKNLTNGQFTRRVASTVRELGLLKRLIEG